MDIQVFVRACEEAIRDVDSGAHFVARGAPLPAWRLQKCTMIVYLPKGAEKINWRTISSVLSLLQKQYPERLYRALIFPCGRGTAWFWSLVKVFLGTRVANKVVFLEGGRRPPVLAEFVDSVHVPERFRSAH